MKFIIKQKLPSMNEVIRKNRTNRYTGNSYKQDIENQIGWYILQAKAAGNLNPLGEQSCIINMTFYEKTKKRDVDNIQSSQKFILDALQKYGILKNDNRKYVKQIYHEIKDATSDYVIVNIQPIEE